eukprot:TRINITY_DN43491_c0_g1_i1.p1 TRINITY_DN43491_c0_g1~~TRINITY_DN43491_c0_g1_i1.p1  ORF type:complete len:696 (+),score=280.03 TRINITY_DN43491_c0_g1_i1:61-2088(+)
MDPSAGRPGSGTGIPPNVQRMLSDGKAETRKRGAEEIEAAVRAHCARRAWHEVHNLIDVLHSRFIHSVQTSVRKGGLLALSCIAVAAEANVKEFVRELVAPVLFLFNEEKEASVRYHAAETLYNIAKVARGYILSCFSDIFDGLCRLHGDRDRMVLQAAGTLDELIKGVCTETREFDVDGFVCVLRRQIQNGNPYVRHYLLTWLSVLDTVPDLHLVCHLPDILGGVLQFLSDHNKQVVYMAEKVLKNLLKRLQQRCAAGCTVEWGPVVAIVIKSCSIREENVRDAALGWAIEVLTLAQRSTLPQAANLLSAVLSCVSDREEKIRMKAMTANEQLASLVRAAQLDDAEEGRGELEALLPLLFDALTRALSNPENATRCAALVWLQMLLQHHPHMVEKCFDRLFPELMSILSDPSDRVVEMDLQVLAMITKRPESFERFMTELVELLQRDGYKLMPRAGMVVKALAPLINSINLFRTLAAILSRQEDLNFVSSLVTTLNVILLTSPELLPLRTVLKRGLEDPEAHEIFVALYKSWCFNAVAVVSLCLLSRAYELSCTLIKSFGEREITVSMMVQIDKLVQLLESPVFTYIRVALLEPAEHPYLVKTLFGILMLLPQSSTFEYLHKRLKNVNTLCNLNNRIEAHPRPTQDWAAMLESYREVEERKESYFRAQQSAQHP